jgi:hypothetical protein
MKTILLAAAVLVAIPALGQTHHPVRVDVEEGNNNATTKEVTNRLIGQIGSSSRYALLTDTAADVLVLVECLPVTVREQRIGVACHTELMFYSVSGVGIATDLTGYMGTGAELDVAQDLFDSFVKQTSDEKLSVAAMDFKRRLNLAIQAFPKGVE